EVVAWDRSAASVALLEGAGVRAAASLEALAGELRPPRVVWVMVPAGPATEETLERLGAILAPGDVVIDGGNAHYPDSVRRARALAERGVHLLDAGTSGGVWGREQGYCLM